jgi:hypothetical protein
MSSSLGKAMLSKTAFLNGRQCRKRLWLQWNAPEHAEDGDPQGEGRMRKGRDIGRLARECFPGGADAGSEPFDPEASLRRTRELMDDGEDVIYEAAFRYNDLFASVDILVRKGPHWHAYEVKSGTSVKEHYLHDCAFQYFVLKGAKIPIGKFFILHIDNRFVLEDRLEPRNLFQRVPVMKRIQPLQGEIAQLLPQMKSLLDTERIPDVDIGPHCRSPYPCPFTGHCWSHVPRPSVFDIMHLGSEKKFRLYYGGISRQEEIPDDFPLSDAQKMQVRATASGEPFVDLPRLKDWMASLQYPLHLVDFECFQPAIPIYPGTRPYQQLPFQFSVHRIETTGGPARHESFLAEAGPDPRPEFIAALLRAVGDTGTVLAYNRDFEVGRLKDLARDYPAFREEIQQLIDRVGDLMLPFEKKWYYAPGMQGSHSIKSVLPALVPGLHYDALAIADGQAAAESFEALFHIDDPTLIQKIRQDLLAYCTLDTSAMVAILGVLESAYGH